MAAEALLDVGQYMHSSAMHVPAASATSESYYNYHHPIYVSSGTGVGSAVAFHGSDGVVGASAISVPIAVALGGGSAT